MSLSLLIASRGRPAELLRTIAETDARVSKPGDLTISVALDWDDESVPEPPKTRSRLLWSISEREHSLGEKYNRCQRNAPAHTYLLGADDNIFTTEGWDEIIRARVSEFEDGFGFVYFGRLDGTLPTQMAIPHQLVDAQGFLFPAHWPVWFHDTWTDEIAHMAGRILWADVAVDEIGGRGKSRGVRDISFWAALFDATRPERLATAEALSAKFNPPWLQTQLLQRREILSMFFRSRMERLRNPATANQYERRMSFDAPADERYLQIKKQAEAMLDKLLGRAA